ncbi:hypothetical protein Tco_0652475 [Tanacetum coccineum]|uniref:Transposase (putative) gypsy type domain-containing protein n=1 Tax=Tanacetum coccineum TaxID=301880 RepID=A0ABQ4WYD1_9ASTR
MLFLLRTLRCRVRHIFCSEVVSYPHAPFDATMHERPAGKVGMYTRFFDYANYRIPFSNFFVSVLIHFRIPFSQLSVFGSAKVSHFEILCRVCNIEPDVSLFRYFYTHNYKNGWFGFTKRPNVRACYSKNLDSVKNWNDHFFWVDEFVVPANARFRWFSGSTIAKDRAPAPSEYDIEHVNTLIAHASPFLRFPEEFLCWVGISQMDLNAFIRTADPRKVKTVERARVENEIPIVTVAKHRTVTLLPTSVSPISPLSSFLASYLRRVIGQCGKGFAGDAVLTTVARNFSIIGRTGCSHSSYLTLYYFFRGKQRIWREGGDRTDSVTGPSLRTIGPSVRFVVLSDSSHHSGTNSAGPEVDSLARSDAPLMTEATTVTIPTDGKVWKCFDAGSIREERHRRQFREVYVLSGTVTKGFGMNDGRLCAKMIDHFTPPAFFKTVRGMEHEQLFTEFNVSAARNLSLSSEVRMRAEYNILEKRKWKSLAEERNVLLEAKDREALRFEISVVKGPRRSRGELSDLGASSSSLRSENQSLLDQVHKLELSSADLRLKLETYEGVLAQLEEFQDNLMGPLRTRNARSADFTRGCINAFFRRVSTRIFLTAGCRCLAELEAYIPSAEDDFNSAIRDLRDLNFPLLQELSNKKDASTWEIMDILRLDDIVAETLGMPSFKPDAD